jgi:hypothetical protein
MKMEKLDLGRRGVKASRSGMISMFICFNKLSPLSKSIS